MKRLVSNWALITLFCGMGLGTIMERFLVYYAPMDFVHAFLAFTLIVIVAITFYRISRYPFNAQ